MKNLIMLFLTFLLLMTSALAGDKTIIWDLYTDEADGLNVYRAPSVEDGGIVLVWILVNSTLISITETTYLDTAVPGWYCWKITAVSGVFETDGSNFTCEEITLSKVTGVR